MNAISIAAINKITPTNEIIEPRINPAPNSITARPRYIGLREILKAPVSINVVGFSFGLTVVLCFFNNISAQIFNPVPIIKNKNPIR